MTTTPKKAAAAKRTKRTDPLSASIAQRPAAARAKKAAEKKVTAAPVPAPAPAPAASPSATHTAPAPDGRVITLLATANPKRPGSAAHRRFALYRTGMTVAAFVAAGGQRIDVAYDAGHGFIRLDKPAA